MGKATVGGIRLAACAILTLLLALCGPSIAHVEVALADQAPASSAGTRAAASGVPYASGPSVAYVSSLPVANASGRVVANASGQVIANAPGQAIAYARSQAIACVSSGHEIELAQVADSIEFLLAIDAQTSGCGPCELVLVKSSTRSAEDLVAALEACEGVVFAEPDYRAELQAGGTTDQQPEDAADQQAGGATQQSGGATHQAGGAADRQSRGTVDQQAGGTTRQSRGTADQQAGGAADRQSRGTVDQQPGGAIDHQSGGATQQSKGATNQQSKDATNRQARGATDLQAGDLQPAVPTAATRPDYTGRQYAFNGEFGIGVPNWNTYDGGGRPTPSVSAAGKVVAVLDTGVDYNHEDLRDAMWSEGEYYPALVALGGGAYGINVSVPRSDKTPYDTTDPMDDGMHGTHVAGIIAGEWNGLGISGAASGAKIMAVKVLNDEGAMGVSAALRGYRYVVAAQRAGVDVVAINNSWGDDVYSKALDMAVREAGRLGAVSTFAAGNERRDIDMVGQVTNALINNPYVVVVGNSNKNGQIAESSSYGKRAVDVFAPGQDIFSTIPTGEGPADETADPLVAGGVTYACDYESTVVKDNADNSAFGLKGVEGTTLAVANEGRGASARSLSLTATAGETMTASVDSKALAAGAECRGLCLWMKAPAAKLVDCMLVYDKVDGASEQFLVKLDQPSSDWRLVAFPIVAKAKKDDLKLALTITVHEWQGLPDATILVDDVKLTSATAPYDYQSGTSMASPAVAGGAAVLAAAFPGDDAARRAARVVGSVKPVASLADQCVSGGIFRLDKALARDTGPVLNSASTQAGAVTVEGFFFGAAPGSLAVEGQALPVVSWSDTAIVAQLPAGFAPGEKLVQVTTSAGKSGHQRFRIGTPSSLYRRLPLPGRTLSGDPGDYGIASSEFDESFYAATPRALVGLGGSLYYLLETGDETCAIFRYDIDGRTWEYVYEGGYAPGGGACTWNGRILFVAGQSRENKTYFGLFDPVSRTAEYFLYNDQCFERERTLVNTGKGILLAGGRMFVYGSNKELSIDTVSAVDMKTLAISPVALPEGVSLPDSWYSGVYDEEGNGYLFGGARMNGFYKFSFADGGVTCTVLKNGPLYDEPGGAAQLESDGGSLGGGDGALADGGDGPQVAGVDARLADGGARLADGDDAPLADGGARLADGGNALHALSASAGESMPDDQGLSMVAGPTKSGIASSGPVTANDAGAVIADTYSTNWGDTKFTATDKQMSVTKMFNLTGTTYRGQFYVIGASESEVGGRVFASQPVETFAQPGDVPSTPVKPSTSAPSSSSVPKTGDALSLIAPVLAALCSFALIVAYRVRRRS